MPVGLSDGTYHEDYTLMVADSASRMPLGSPTEPAGALKPAGGSQTPGNTGEVDWSKLNQPFGDLKSTSKEDTPLVASAAGGLIKITEGDIAEATNVAMGAGPGTMIGIKAKGFDKNLLAQAQIMLADGVHPDDVFRKTGMFKGQEGRWRQEIDDSKSVFAENWAPRASDTESFATLLPQILHHPELYKSYPQLKDVRVRFDPKHPSAHWDVQKNEIVVGETFKQDKGIIFHEIQHAIQNIEGFAKGTYPGKAGVDFSLKLQDAIMPVANRLKELYKKGETSHLTEAEYGERKHLIFLVDKYNEYAKAGTKESYNNYMKSAGETEARNVDTRIHMSGKERRDVPPWYTQDLPAELQIPVTDPNQSTAYGIYNIKTGKTVK